MIVKCTLLSFFIFLGMGCTRHPKESLRDFTIPELGAAGSVTLSQETAQGPVLLVFWASWCPGCVEEIPHLNEWQERFTSRGLKILSVNVQEPREDVEKFVKDAGIRYRVALDLEGKVAHQYGLVGLPASVFLAKGGKILYYGFSLPQSIEGWLS